MGYLQFMVRVLPELILPSVAVQKLGLGYDFELDDA
jgi:hypothetical protein